jgi:hypothetical protein
MKRVFLGGSRKVSRLNDIIRRRLEQLTERRLQIVIGDANGADRAIQRQLAEWAYPNVEVFFVGPAPRNNVGHWPTRQIPTPRGVKGFEFYAIKDREMAEEADGGLMLWDGESRGTLANIENLLREKKPVVLYVSPAHRFLALTSLVDLAQVQDVLTTRNDAEPSAQGDLGVGADTKTTSRRSRRRTA